MLGLGVRVRVRVRAIETLRVRNTYEKVRVRNV